MVKGRLIIPPNYSKKYIHTIGLFRGKDLRNCCTPVRRQHCQAFYEGTSIPGERGSVSQPSLRQSITGKMVADGWVGGGGGGMRGYGASQLFFLPTNLSSPVVNILSRPSKQISYWSYDASSSSSRCPRSRRDNCGIFCSFG